MDRHACREFGIILFLAAAVSCAAPTREEGLGSYVHVAACSIDTLTTLHIEGLLKSKGIPCAIWGSIVYTVRVPAGEADRARAILLEEASKRPVSMEVETHSKSHVALDFMWEEAVLNRLHRWLLSTPGFSAVSDIGGVLRDPEMAAAIRKFPWIVSVKSCAREYMDLDGRYKWGHDFEIVVGEGPDVESHRLFFQAWEDGRHVHYRGGFGTAYGDR